jgi:hypothetical protein
VRLRKVSARDVVNFCLLQFRYIIDSYCSVWWVVRLVLSGYGGDQMKLTALVSLFVFVLCLIAEPKNVMAATPTPTPTPPAVVLLWCNAVLGADINSTVAQVDASINSPPIMTGGSCAAALQLLLSQGFKVGKVTGTFPYTLLYTMVRGDITLN